MSDAIRKIIRTWSTPFDQSALVLDYPGHPRLRALPVSVVRGHFEREPNEVIIQSSTLEIGRVVHFREFAAGGAKLDPLTYLVFGRDGENFMAHLLSAPPDFDQVLSVTLGESAVSEELLRDGLYVSFPGRTNNASERLRQGETVSCRFDPGDDAEPMDIELTVTADLYCEAGEVGQVGFDHSRPCP